MKSFSWNSLYLLALLFGINLNSACGKYDRSEDDVRDASVYRLPTNVVPISYELRMLTKLAANDFDYPAKVRITFDVLEETNTIILHADKLRIDKERSFLYQGTRNISIHDQYLDDDKQFYVIELATNLTLGPCILTVFFVGKIHDDVFGFYRSSYEVDGREKWIGITQFSPTYARRAFPCMDEPRFKATFTISIGHYANETATSNTEVAKIEETLVSDISTRSFDSKRIDVFH